MLLDLSAEPGARLRVACVLARLEPSSADSMRAFAASLAEAIITEQPHMLTRWIELLGPVSGLLDPHLREICGDLGRDATRAVDRRGASGRHPATGRSARDAGDS